MPYYPPQTSYTAGTLNAIKSEIYGVGGIRAAEKKNFVKDIDKVFKIM
jgi:hypothetical protein